LQPLKAQNFFIKHYDSILQPIDKTPVTSHILIDRVGPINQIVGFNNNTDTTNYDNALQSYMELYNSNYRKTRMTEPSKLMYNIELQNLQNRVPIQVLDYAYQQIDPNALQNGLLVNNNGIINNAAGNPNPFLNKRIQLTTLMVDKIKTTNFKFYVAPHFISRNTGVSVSSINIVGNGLNITMNGVWDSAAVSLPSYGDFYFNITTTLSDGTSFLTKNLITVGETNNSGGFRTTGFEAPPACHSTNFPGNIPWQGYDEGQAYTGMFDLDIYYRKGISCANGVQPLKSPVILIDGFDPTDKRNTKNRMLYTKFLNYFDDVNFLLSDSIKIDFVDTVRGLGKDVILVDIPTYFHLYNSNVQIHLDSNATPPPPGYSLADGLIIRGGGDYVERNAMTMVALLIDIQNQMAAAGSTDSIVLIGPSMGGQITRYALKYMEDRGIPHRVRLWISQDSNHEGATVPIGEQLVIAELAVNNIKPRISRDRQLLCPANKQFIVDHVLKHVNDIAHVYVNDPLPGGAPGFFNRYKNTIDSIGWPQLCRKIATISGAENGNPLDAPSAGQEAMSIQGKLRGIYSPIPFVTPFTFLANLFCNSVVNLDCEVFDVKMYTVQSPNNLGMVAQLRIKGDHPVSKSLYTVGPNQTRSQSLEVVQSGFYHGYNELASFIEPVVKGWSSHFPYNWSRAKFSTNVYANQHAFQPTGSTLAYGKGTNPNVYNTQFKWDDDVTMFNLSCDKYIPFDYYMGPKTFSVLHDSIFYPQALVLIDEIQGIKHVNEKPTQVLLLKNLDTSKRYFCANETLYFSAENYYFGLNVTPTWVVDNNYFQIISGQGTSTVGVKYLGGMPYQYMMQSISPFITITGESNCYKYTPINQIGIGIGDVWGGTVSSVTTGAMGFDLQFAPGYNLSDRARIKINAGLLNKETNLQQYTLMQNTYGTAMTWNVTPINIRGRIQNQLNITSNLGGEYVYRINDANRCGTNQLNSFSIAFSARQLYWRISPNPAQDVITIIKEEKEENTEQKKPTSVSIVIKDIYNKQILYKATLINNTVFKIPAHNLKNGEYVIEIKYGGEFYTEKLWIRK
jgi:hypothetical protein